jgi:hypothetical protein
MILVILVVAAVVLAVVAGGMVPSSRTGHGARRHRTTGVPVRSRSRSR